MKVLPTGNRILVKKDSGIKSVNGLIIPNSDSQSSGVVISIGLLVNEVAVGDKIIFGSSSGTEISINNEPYLLMSDASVFGKITE